jgi:stage IV sporulation protein FB
MGWSISLGRFAGTEVRIHLTFLLLVAWLGIAAGLSGGREAALSEVVLVLAVFACVLLHEFGHVLAARRYGIATRDITLLPIGGVASLERMPEKPSEELVIALAGPLVNVVIAAALMLGLGVDLSSAGLRLIEQGQAGLPTRLAHVNIALVLFNLIPAFPMDGGRVLRALLAMRMDRARATRIAATIGQAAAFGLGFLGLFGNPLLILIAVFIFMAASGETYATEMSEAARGSQAQRATMTELAVLRDDATVEAALVRLLSTSQTEFPVTDADGRLSGILTRDGMLRAMAETGPATPVSAAMIRDIPVVHRRAPLAEAVRHLQSMRVPAVGVVDDDGRAVGIITLENLAELMLIRDASASWHRRPATSNRAEGHEPGLTRQEH